MTVGSTRSILSTLLVDRYLSLKRRLASRLGSSDIASEALHETWLSLSQGNDLGPVENPESYVYRSALHNGQRLLKAQQRLLNASEISELFDLADEAPDPERVAAGKSEIRYLKQLLNGLTRRQRMIFLECYIGDGTYAELAERLHVSVRSVQSELREAMIQIALGLDKNRFARTGFKVSKE